MKLNLENTFADQLGGLYSPHTPQGFVAPTLLLHNDELARRLGLPILSADEAAAVYSGSDVPQDARPLAQAYAGHQFGGFSPSLGDGRALLLGELRTADGQLFDLQLKGSGRTEFSRGGDGLAALGPVLREYIVSQGMFRLGVPTTRVLAAVSTGEVVTRDRPLPGAVLARIASSHLRVGTLQYFAARNDQAKLKRLVTYALQRHYPEGATADNAALALLEAVTTRQARLIADWMLLGFIHGVMNTDNMTLSGETIDYGPCAFMEAYDPETVFSSIDRHGRYAFGNQPPIGLWNLGRMAAALLPLLAGDKDAALSLAQEALEGYRTTYERHWLAGMSAKLGLPDSGLPGSTLEGESSKEEALITDLLAWMQATRQDYTLTFRRLASGLLADEAPFEDPAFVAWFGRWRALHGQEPVQEIAARMNAVNPLYIPRNHRVEAALDAALTGDLDPTRELLAVLESPYEERLEHAKYAEPAPADFGPYKTFCGT